MNFYPLDDPVAQYLQTGDKSAHLWLECETPVPWLWPGLILLVELEIQEDAGLRTENRLPVFDGEVLNAAEVDVVHFLD